MKAATPPNPSPISEGEREELERLLEKATKRPWHINLHHTRDYAGRTHAMIDAGEIVPLAAVVLGVEGCSQDEGRANAALIPAAVNALPRLLSSLKRCGRDEALEEAIGKLIEAAETAEKKQLWDPSTGKAGYVVGLKTAAEIIRALVSADSRSTVMNHEEQLTRIHRLVQSWGDADTTPQGDDCLTTKYVKRLIDHVRRVSADKEKDGAPAVAAPMPSTAEASAASLLWRWQSYGCPDCNGDCAAANPPIVSCIMRETAAAIKQASENAEAKKKPRKKRPVEWPFRRSDLEELKIIAQDVPLSPKDKDGNDG